MEKNQMFILGDQLFPYVRSMSRNPQIEIGNVYRISDLPEDAQISFMDVLRMIDPDMLGRDRVEICKLCRGVGFYLYHVTSQDQRNALTTLSELGMRIVNDDDRTPSIRMDATYTVSDFPTDDRKDQVIEKLKQLDVDCPTTIYDQGTVTFLNDHYMRNHALMILIGLGCTVVEVDI